MACAASPVSRAPLPHLGSFRTYRGRAIVDINGNPQSISPKSGSGYLPGGATPRSARPIFSNLRSSPVVPLLWRPHDHCRGLCARRRTARSPVLRPRHQNRNPMRLATTSLHHPLAGAPRSRRRATVISATANSDATPRAVPKSRCRAQQRRPIRDRQRQFALNDAGQRLSRPTRCPIKSP
jgi:hypothetical protein